MTLSLFLSCAYTLLADSYRKAGMDVMTACDRVNETLGLPVGGEQPETPNPAVNAQSLRALEQQLGGL